MMEQVLLQLLLFVQSFSLVSNVHPYVGPYDPSPNRAGQPYYRAGQLYDIAGQPYDGLMRRQEILFINIIIAFGQINHDSGHCLHCKHLLQNKMQKNISKI